MADKQMITFEAPKDKTAAEELRHIVRNFDSTSETFLDDYTIEQLIQIHRAWMASEWDFYPDQWASWQVKDALNGIVPEWDDNEKPKRPAKVG